MAYRQERAYVRMSLKLVLIPKIMQDCIAVILIGIVHFLLALLFLPA